MFRWDLPKVLNTLEYSWNLQLATHKDGRYPRRSLWMSTGRKEPRIASNFSWLQLPGTKEGCGGVCWKYDSYQRFTYVQRFRWSPLIILCLSLSLKKYIPRLPCLFSSVDWPFSKQEVAVSLWLSQYITLPNGCKAANKSFGKYHRGVGTDGILSLSWNIPRNW